ncbi:NAD(P)-binding protein [Trematosphaeria pertusa]|uniref:NAD(P)-binding protein n=1 Tax=Trematosphaeria pertusa TaxID=390896 RepID=A0A6A6IS86_9PLEO|nr:NAD(P)-binding protein [Trematosphaeria pertusa]KAF2253415.1 NAD(P)-binding protein [Trematosphaeria pertusa]
MAQHPNRLENAHVVVFGGTSGIGYAVASMALSNGAHVTISGSTQPKVDTKVQALCSLYPSAPPQKVSGHAVDLADTENLEGNLTTFFDKATQNGAQPVDHIAFTSGDALNIPTISNVTPETALHAFKVRYLGASLIAKVLTNNPQYMPRAASSSFTLTSGTNCAKPSPGFTFGTTVGSAMEGLSRGLAVDMKPIRVNVVSPGAIQTEMLQGFIDKMGPTLTEQWKKASLLDGIGQPEDTAEAYGYIMKDRFITGERVNTDGGRLLV